MNNCLTLITTAENVEWNPYSEEFSQLEQAYGTPFHIPLTKRAMNFILSQEHEIIDSIQQNMGQVSTIKSAKPRLYVPPEELIAYKWAVGET